MKRYPTGLEKIFVIYLTSVQNTLKILNIQLQEDKLPTQKLTNNLNKYFITEEIIGLQVHKTCSHHWSLGKYKLKPE